MKFYKFTFILFFSFLINSQLYCEDLIETQQNNSTHKKTFIEALLPSDHPLQNDLKSLFKDPNMFNSQKTFKAAGFIVHKRVHEGLMVAKHPKIKNFIFKKYANVVPKKIQLDKYLLRINNARILEDYITAHNHQHLVVPKKWIYPLPKTNKKGEQDYILIAEDMDIVPGEDDPNGENVKLYANMSEEMMYELCTTMYNLGGCDAWPRNQPFTNSGKIAFVDTEHLGQKRKHFRMHIIPILNKELQIYAHFLWDQLEYEEQTKYANTPPLTLQ